MGRTMTVSAERCPISIEADRLREEARVRKEDNLAKITKVCVDAREEADSWYNTKVLETNTDYQGKQTEYNDAVNALNLEHQRCIDETTTVFNTQKNNLIANQQEDETSAEKCSVKVTELIQGDKDCYNVNKQELDNLWHQVTGTMLHERSIIAYEQLKSPVTDLSKFKHYSLLVAYLQQLTTSDVISKAEFDTFKGFSYTLCNSNNVERDHNFKEADSKFLALLKSREYQDSQMAYSACQEDYVKHVKTYKDAIELNVVLYNKVVEVKKEINVKYQQALIELTAKHQQKQEELQSHYTEMLTTTANSWGDYQNKHQGCLADLESSKNSQLTEINNYENTEKEKVNDQYNAELNTIEEAVKRKLQEIQELSDAHAAQRKRLRKSKFINACISITAGVAAVFSGGLLSGVSEIVAQAVQTSLIATSLRALERLVNRKDKFGLDIHFSLSGPTPEKFTPSNRANRDTATPTMDSPQFNLTTVRERFAAIQQNVKSWQATIEHDLFYSLHREILPVGNFSNALVNYGRQNTNNMGFSCNANLGALQANGYRSVAWNILSNNQTKWSGMDFMRDSDLCNIMRRFNVSNNAISGISNWHRPQVLSFNSNYVSSSKPMVEGPLQVSENIDRGFKFLHGFGKGVAINTVTTAACSIPVVGGVLLTAGGGLIYGHAASMATKFEQDNFTLTREHREIMRNPLLSDAEKQKHLQDAQVRYEQAKQQRLNAGGVVTRVKNMWEQHPEGLGNSIGLFFGFGRLGPTGSGVCASTILPIKPQLPFKFGWSKQQHTHILEKKFNIPPGKEHCDFITGHGGVHGYENFANARATANFRANLGDDAVPFLQEIGPYRNNIYTGMQSLDGNRGWRLDFNPRDSNIGGHINWWHISEIGKIYRGMIKVDHMDSNLYWDILSHFPRTLPTI